MHIGIQLCAPQGYRGLSSDTVYHLLRSDAQREVVTLVRFVDRPVRAHIVRMSRAEFEQGLSEKLIVPAAIQHTLPPALQRLEGFDLGQLDDRRIHPAKMHLDRVTQRVSYLKPALDQVNDILRSHDPERAVNAVAKQISPPQHPTRYRAWFFAYIVFGYNAWVLLPTFLNVGSWSRHDRKEPPKKCGRRSTRHGMHSGYAVDAEMVQRIRDAYLRHAGLGVRMRTIYVRSMRQDFGCKAERSATGRWSFFHPDGKSFPTENQFRYRCRKEFTLEVIQRTLYGDARYRDRLAATTGNFHSRLTDLLERVEADGWFSKELPRSFVSDAALPPLCVVVLVCATSGRRVGIGFSLGSETEAAYRMALFCAAVPKRRFGSWFNMAIGDGDWDGEGLPLSFLVDRGPGVGAHRTDDAPVIAIAQMAPPWTPQSKAIVESKHPRSVRPQGAPKRRRSQLNPVEMARSEIFRLMKQNDQDDASSRMTPDMYVADVVPSPNGIWKYLDQRGRTSAYPVSFDEAVRKWLTPVDFVIRNGMAYLHEQPFNSPALAKSGVLSKRAESFNVTGYVLNLCVRHAWLDINGRIVEVDAQMQLVDDDRMLWVSILELEQYKEVVRRSRLDGKDHRNAADVGWRQRIDDNIGTDLDTGRWHVGPLKHKTIEARQEVAQAIPKSTRKRRA
jgi:hypothetical protein